MRYLRELIKAQARMGYEIELLGVGKGSPETIKIEGVQVYYIPISSTLSWPRYLLGLFLFLLKNRKDYHGNLIHIHRIYFAPPFKLLLRNTHIVSTIHSKTFAVLTNRIMFTKHILPALLAIERLLISTCIDQLSAAGDYASKLYEQRHKIRPNTIIQLRCPSSICPTEKKHPKIAGNTKKILCVGRLAPVKRPLQVLELFKNSIAHKPSLANDYELIFIGDGEDREKLFSSAMNSSIKKNVKIIGSIPAEEMPEIYACGTALALLSSSEVAPFAIKEALTAGLSIFATDVGIVREYVPETCGMIIPVNNPEHRTQEFIDFLEKEYSREACQRHANSIKQKEEALFSTGLRTLYRHSDNIRAKSNQ